MSNKTGRKGAVYIEPDSLPVVIPAIVGALTVGGVSFAMSWDALRVVATWAGVTRTWGLPVALDAAILVFTAFWLIAKRRRRPVWFQVGMVGLFTLGSMGGNVAHALADGAGIGWQTTVGAIAAAVFPVTTFAMTHVMADLLVDPDADVRSMRAPRARRTQPQPAPVLAAALTSPSGTAPTATPAPVLPASVRTGTPTGRQSGGGASVTERLEAVRALDAERPGLSERMAAAALCETHGDAAWISRTTVARMRRRIAEENGAGVRGAGLAAVG